VVAPDGMYTTWPFIGEPMVIVGIAEVATVKVTGVAVAVPPTLLLSEALRVYVPAVRVKVPLEETLVLVAL